MLPAESALYPELDGVLAAAAEVHGMFGGFGNYF